MKITLFTVDGITDENLILNILKEYKVKYIHVATTKAYEIAKEYTSEENITKHDKGRKLMRLYDAIAASENTFFFYNGNTPTDDNPQDGYRTSKAYTNAINNNKNIFLFPYKASSFEVNKNGEYTEISFFNRIKDGQNIKKVILNNKELEHFIETLKK